MKITNMISMSEQNTNINITQPTQQNYKQNINEGSFIGNIMWCKHIFHSLVYIAIV